MRTSLNETEQIEAYLYGANDPGDILIFEARLLLEPGLHEKVLWQKKTYEMINLYSRNQLKQEIETVHQKLFTKSEYNSFRQKIRRLFLKR